MAFMRHNNNQRRHNNNRHRHSNTGSSNNGSPRRHVNRLNQVLDSNGPEGRVRGTAQQIVEKYATMARDAASAGDKVLMLNYLQHAEHYQRLLNEINEENAEAEREREAMRTQHHAQPDINPDDAQDGQGTERQGAERERNAQHNPDNAQNQRRSRAPRAIEAVDSNNAADDDGDDDNELPNFLRVPIKSAPEAQPAETGVVEKPVRRVGRPRAAKPVPKAEDAAE